MNTDFIIEAIGDNIQFHWQKDGCDLSNGDKHHGTNSKILHIVEVDEGDKGCYRCLVKNDVGEKFSNEAHLIVLDSKLIIRCLLYGLTVKSHLVQGA